MIALAGVVAVLGFAAYLSLRSQPQAATGFRVAVNSGANPAAVAARPVQPASSLAASSAPVVQDTRLPAPTASVVPATAVRGGGVYRVQRQRVAQLRPAVDFARRGSAVDASSAAQGQALTAASPGVAGAVNSGSGPQIVAANSPPSTPPAAPATPASAVLMPHGSILLNGHPVTDSTALFPGDRIQVPGTGYASINGNGSLSVLQPGASVVYTPKGLQLQQGGVAVSTLTGMPVDTEGLSIVPRAGHGKYDVLDDNGSVQVASLEGDLNIMDGGQATLLPAGQQTTRDRRKKAADAPSGGPTAPETPPATASGGFPTGKVLLITGAVGGGVAAAILLTRSSSKPVSPAVP